MRAPVVLDLPGFLGRVVLDFKSSTAMTKFQGTIEDLKTIVTGTGYDGDWRELPGGQHQFHSTDKAILNWWQSNQTILFQGPEPAKSAFRSTFEAACGSDFAVPVAREAAAAVLASRTVFVVHGHDETSREQLERILLILGLEPFVLQNTAADGMTIIEALERQIGHTPEAKFGIVLMTPDDMGYPQADGPDAVKPRARQNVIMEMGMLLSSLTREKVVILVKGHVELPSDAQGIIYLNFNDHVREVMPRLAQRLSAAGFELDPDRVARASI